MSQEADLESLEQPTICIHVLRAGFAACGFSLEAPGKWPEGNLWTSVPKEVTCVNCQQVLAREGLIVLRS